MIAPKSGGGIDLSQVILVLPAHPTQYSLSLLAAGPMVGLLLQPIERLGVQRAPLLLCCLAEGLDEFLGNILKDQSCHGIFSRSGTGALW